MSIIFEARQRFRVIMRNIELADNILDCIEGIVAGFVQGPASATDNAIARYNGTTGKIIKNSSATLSDCGIIDSKFNIISKSIDCNVIIGSNRAAILIDPVIEAGASIVLEANADLRIL